YEETEDQLRCIEEIKADMESDRPMERLLCGDVGFGKTEVALRAAFKCVLDSKQCAILCPTTILAWQHYQTALARIGNFPVNIELLSRFRTPKEQKQVLQKLRTGQVDIIIGTHRLVQKDVAFSDLGLAIIDEEQRFGVTHKERFKEMFRGVDVLTLSATPIPRTLNMAMSGIRDMSVIEQAPQDRHPIQTYVIEHDYGVIADAIKRELRRDGQVYYIHNRVESIQSCAAQISKLVPDARIGIAHGKMGENELSRIWQQLMEHEIDILVCTTIIETGVDVSNCNTLIIEDADNMGLSQLYQLRGRVGRSKRRASAYFTFRRGKVLTEIASKRLSAIREFTKFGSGFRIALRDLEIRGAGSILGERQHGHMEAVGYDMYLRLLSDAVSEKQGVKPPTKVEECLIDLPMEAHIPEDYIENLAQRLDIYRKIASLESHEQSLELIDELIDRFGDPPKSVQGLIDIALLRAAAAKLGFTEISQKGVVMLFFPKNLDMEVASRLAAHLKGRVMVNAGQKPHIAVKMKGSKPLDVIREVLFVSNPT
ncbi:MAG: TRCF domain-containing protein, partial [Massilioclostridium sp.]|nr:TRCF domain-containing protein [Massilioclostridium sp.]